MLCFIAGQDSRTSYAGHVCGRAHFQFIHQRLDELKRLPEALQQAKRNEFFQHWIFILGEVPWKVVGFFHGFQKRGAGSSGREMGMVSSLKSSYGVKRG